MISITQEIIELVSKSLLATQVVSYSLAPAFLKQVHSQVDDMVKLGKRAASRVFQQKSNFYHYFRNQTSRLLVYLHLMKGECNTSVVTLSIFAL